MYNEFDMSIVNQEYLETVEIVDPFENDQKTTRKLATVRKVSELIPIEGADRIELAQIDGWQCIVVKGAFKPGDIGVYFEIDSFLPIDEKYNFLKKNCYKNTENLGEGFHIKTMKMKGVVSQGLFLPFSELHKNVFGFHLHEGMDLTEELGVQKYEKPVPAHLSGRVKGTFPIWIPKTDQERIQNIFDRMKKRHNTDKWEISMKLDGSSMTVYYHEGKFGVCSRNWEIDMIDENKDNAFVRCVKLYQLDKILPILSERFGNIGIALQGELMGPGVQKNRESLDHLQFWLYDIFDITNQKYFTSEKRLFEGIDTLDIIQEELDNDYFIDHVPIIHPGLNWLEHAQSINDLHEIFYYTDAGTSERVKWSSLYHPIPEGVVAKNVNKPEITFKLINNDYLLKCEE